jgi:hypothetical protein
MLGIRVTSAGEGSRAFFTDPAGDWLWAAAERNGLPAMVSPPGLLPEVNRLAERHPGMRFVVDHLALARHGKDDGAFADMPNLIALAKRPNVAVKASALPRYSTEPYPYPRQHPHLRQVFDAFGPQMVYRGGCGSRFEDECASPSVTMSGSRSVRPRASRKERWRWRISLVLMCR